MNRTLYLLAMYTGVRAGFNQVRGFFLPRTRVSKLHGSTLQLNSSGDIAICVNARPASKALNAGVRAGMVSMYLLAPDIPKLLYRLARLTSHFGTGHIEMAFYEDGETVVFFAVRNILRSNINRLGVGRYFRNLSFNTNDDEIMAIQGVFQALGSRGIKATFAPPEVCLELAISKSLLNQKTRDQTIKSMMRRYKRIERQIEMHYGAANDHPDSRMV